MAVLTLRTLTNAGDTTKSAPLTNDEVDQNFINLDTELGTKANSASPTFTGTVVLPSTTSIGTITSTELGYVDGVTSAIQTQLNGKAPLASPSFTGTVDISTSTTALKLPVGTTAQQPGVPTGGMLRYNSESTKFEGYAAGAWGSIGGGATGATGNSMFWENDQIVSANYTITAGKNAGTFGPVSVANGVVVTVPNGSNWTIV